MNSKPIQIAVILSEFNFRINSALLDGAKKYLKEKNISLAEGNIFMAPGAFEIPLLAQNLALLESANKTKKYDGIICLGTVIKGDTAHFEFISLGATIGIQQAMLSTNTPISFGILTTYTEQQALDRCQDNAANKGREAAHACLSMIEKLQSISESMVEL